MGAPTPVSAATYEQIALQDQDRQGCWELVDGQLRSKPGDTHEHNHTMNYLAFHIQNQIEDREFEGRVNSTRTKRGNTYSIPDVLFFHHELAGPLKGTGRLEAYEAPLHFVAEVSSPLNREYDEDAKLEEYRLRGDEEIWLVDPYAKTITVWRRQPDRSYVKTYYVASDREAPVLSLPGVIVQFSEIFY